MLERRVEKYCKARAWEQCEEILLPELFGQLTHVRARALGIVSKGWARRAAHAPNIRTEMDDGKFIGLILKYAAYSDDIGETVFFHGNKYVVEGKIFEKDVGEVCCFCASTSKPELDYNSDFQLIFQLDLTPSMLGQLRAGVSKEARKGDKLRLKLNFVFEWYDTVQINEQELLLQFDHTVRRRSSRSARIVSISENSTTLQLEPIGVTATYRESYDEDIVSSADDSDVDYDRHHIRLHPVESRYHKTLWAEHQRQQVTEGVVWYDAAVPEQLEVSLRREIDLLASSNSADYHPFSDDIVRDLVHPSLYPFVRGVSPFFPSSDLACVPEMTNREVLK